MTNEFRLVKRQAENDAAMQALGAELAAYVVPNTVIHLRGSLGAGKTTFTRGFLRGLNYQDKVKSPTYTLVEPYELTAFALYHFDLYRLNHPDELLEIGLDDYFTQTSVCLVEWPEKGGTHLPLPDIVIDFDIITLIDEETAASLRQLRYTAYSPEGDKILARL